MKRLLLCLLCTLSIHAMEEVVVVVEPQTYTQEELTQVVDDLIRMATLITFNTIPEDIYYIPHVKQTLGRSITSPDTPSDDEETEEMRQSVIRRFIRTRRRSLDGLDYNELRRWMLKELEAYNKSTKKELQTMQETIKTKEQEAEDSKRKAKYALMSTIITTIGGIATVVTTFLLTYYLDNQGSD